MQTSLWVYMPLLHISIGYTDLSVHLCGPLHGSIQPPFMSLWWPLYGSVWPLQWVCVAPFCGSLQPLAQVSAAPSTGLCSPFHWSPQVYMDLSTAPFVYFCRSMQLLPCITVAPLQVPAAPSAGLHGFMWTSPQFSVVPSEGLCRSMQPLSEADPGFAMGRGQRPSRGRGTNIQFCQIGLLFHSLQGSLYRSLRVYVAPLQVFIFPSRILIG